MELPIKIKNQLEKTEALLDNLKGQEGYQDLFTNFSYLVSDLRKKGYIVITKIPVSESPPQLVELKKKPINVPTNVLPIVYRQEDAIPVLLKERYSGKYMAVPAIENSIMGFWPFAKNTSNRDLAYPVKLVKTSPIRDEFFIYTTLLRPASNPDPGLIGKYGDLVLQNHYGSGYSFFNLPASQGIYNSENDTEQRWVIHQEDGALQVSLVAGKYEWGTTAYYTFWNDKWRGWLRIDGDNFSITQNPVEASFFELIPTRDIKKVAGSDWQEQFRRKVTEVWEKSDPNDFWENIGGLIKATGAASLTLTFNLAIEALDLLGKMVKEVVSQVSDSPYFKLLLLAGGLYVYNNLFGKTYVYLARK